MAIHWLIYLAMRKGTVFSMMLCPAKFPCCRKRRDQEVRHYKLGPRAPFVVAAWPQFLHPSGRERKRASMELHNLVWPLPVLGKRAPEMLSEAQWCFPTANFSKRKKQHGSLWCAGFLRMCVNPCWEMEERENQMCQQQWLHFLFLLMSPNNSNI